MSQCAWVSGISRDAADASILLQSPSSSLALLCAYFLQSPCLQIT